MIVAFAMVSAVVPSLLMLWYFHSRDTFPEPARVLWATFALGALSIVGVLVVALPIVLLLSALGIGNALAMGFLEAFLTAALPEEAFKLVVLALYAGRHSEFDEPMDGVVYGVAASLGFATLENVMYCATGGVQLAILRALTAVPMHASCGVVMGYFYGRSRYEPHDRGRLLALAYFVPVLLHGLYDFPLLALKRIVEGGSAGASPVLGGLVCAGLFFLMIAVVWSFIAVRRAQKEQRARGAPVRIERAAPVASTGSKILGAALVALGAIVASIGGLLTLGVVLAVAMGNTEGQTLEVLLGGVIIGVLPLAIGLGLFWLGIRVLNRPAPRPAMGYAA